MVGCTPQREEIIWQASWHIAFFRRLMRSARKPCVYIGLRFLMLFQRGLFSDRGMRAIFSMDGSLTTETVIATRRIGGKLESSVCIKLYQREVVGIYYHDATNIKEIYICQSQMACGFVLQCLLHLIAGILFLVTLKVNFMQVLGNEKGDIIF